MKAASKKKSRSQAPPSEKHRRSPLPTSPSRASPPPTDVPAMTPSEKKHRDQPQPSPTSKKRSISQAPLSKKRRRSPLPSSPSRASPPPTDLPAMTPSERKHGDQPQPQSSPTSKKRSISQAPLSKKRRRSPLPSSPSRASPPPTDLPAMTPSERKHGDQPQPQSSPTSKRRSFSQAPLSEKHRRSALPSSPSRASPPPTDLPAMILSERKHGDQPQPQSSPTSKRRSFSQAPLSEKHRRSALPSSPRRASPPPTDLPAMILSERKHGDQPQPQSSPTSKRRSFSQAPLSEKHRRSALPSSPRRASPPPTDLPAMILSERKHGDQPQPQPSPTSKKKSISQAPPSKKHPRSALPSSPRRASPPPTNLPAMTPSERKHGDQPQRQPSPTSKKRSISQAPPSEKHRRSALPSSPSRASPPTDLPAMTSSERKHGDQPQPQPSPTSKKKSISQAPPSEKHRRSALPSSPSRASPPPTDLPAMTPSERKHGDQPQPQPSPTSKKKSISQAPPSKKHRRSPLPSSPSRAPPIPSTDVPATTLSKMNPGAQPQPSTSNNPGRASLPPSPPAPGQPTHVSAEAEAVVPPPIPPSDDQHEGKTGPPKLFQRVWKMDDEITFLNIMLQYKKRLGKEPASSEEFDALYEFVKDSLELKISRNQMMSKRLSMRRKYKGKMARLQMGRKPPADEHEQRSLELARLLWGEERPKDDNGKKRKGRSRGKQKEVLQVGADDSDDVLVRLAEEVCCPKGVLIKKRIMNLNSEKLMAVKERYIKELHMEKKLGEQLAKLEAQIIQVMKAVRQNNDFSSPSGDDNGS